MSKIKLDTRSNFRKALDDFIEYVLVEHRWIFVILFLLPMSIFYDLFYICRARLVFQLNTAPTGHIDKIKEIQKQVKKWISDGRKSKMCTARPGWQTICFRRPIYKNTLHNVDINMVDIVNIDVKRRVVKVEPLVTMGQLTSMLEPLGWTIPVLPELNDLTVGGLVMGTGVETSSHKFGLFQHTCVMYELVLANGDVVQCSKNDKPDLFYCIPWSYGTLGFLTAVEIEIVPANRFVKMEYYPVHSLDHALSLFEEKTLQESDNQFVEAIMFNRDQGVIMVGNMSTWAEPGKLNKIGQWYKPWFFKHVETFLSTGVGVEYIPLRDYYHRHSRSLFWEIQEIIPFGNNPIFRYLFGWMVPPKISLLKLTEPAVVKKLYETQHVIQDMLVPMASLEDTINTFDSEVQVYPLWLCPFKLPNNPGMLHPVSGKEQMYVDVGAYGIPKSKHFEAEKTTRNLEAFVRKVHGYQMLYADTYMTRAEFRSMFKHGLYDELRDKYDAVKAFPEVYDKVSREARD